MYDFIFVFTFGGHPACRHALSLILERDLLSFYLREDMTQPNEK